MAGLMVDAGGDRMTPTHANKSRVNISEPTHQGPRQFGHHAEAGVAQAAGVLLQRGEHADPTLLNPCILRSRRRVG